MITLSSRDNINIKTAIKLKTSAKQRKKSGMFIAEGVRICMDAMLSKAEILIFFSTEKATEKYADEFAQLSGFSSKTFIVTQEIFDAISDTESPQGFLCVIKALDKTAQFDTIKRSGKFVALENIQDPSNLGTILRTAEAFNVSGVVLSADCCDIFSPKVVRGSMGAVFRLPFITVSSIPEFLQSNPQLDSYSAVVDSDADKITDIHFVTPCMVVIGNEGNGLTRQTVDACNNRITIQMKGRAESLNASVAASIIMWEMMK